MIFHVLLGNGQRVRGNIHRIDFRFRESVSAGDSDTAAAGAHIKDVLRIVVNQAGKMVVNEFANRRARHQHAFIDVKLMAAEPGFVGQISDRNALVNTANDALNDAMFFAGSQTRGTHIFRNIKRQIQRRHHQLYGFIPRVIGAVSVPDICSAEAAYRPTQHVLNGMKLIHGFINKNFIHAIPQGTLCYKFGG